MIAIVIAIHKHTINKKYSKFMNVFKNKIYHTHRFITGLCALGLPLVHTIETFLLSEIVGPASSLFCDIIISLVVFGPSVFMICMGFNLSEQRSPKHLFNSGLVFILYGTLLSILRSIIPIVLVCSVVDTTFDHVFSFIVLSDIYIFVGLFLMVFSLFQKLKLSPGLMLFVSVIMLIINCFLCGVFKTDSETVNALIGNIIYVDDGSVFPLFSWTVFPVFGYFAKTVLENKNDKQAMKIMRFSVAVSIVIFTITAVLLSIFEYNVVKIIVSPLNDYKTDIINAVLLLCLNTAFIGIIFFLVNTICKSKMFLPLFRLSKNILPFYTVHWLVTTVVCYVIAAFYTLRETFISAPIMLAVAVFITVLSLFITKKAGYKIVKFMLKTVTLNGLLKF